MILSVFISGVDDDSPQSTSSRFGEHSRGDLGMISVIISGYDDAKFPWCAIHIRR